MDHHVALRVRFDVLFIILTYLCGSPVCSSVTDKFMILPKLQSLRKSTERVDSNLGTQSQKRPPKL